MRFWPVAWWKFGLLVLEQAAVPNKSGIGGRGGDEKSREPVEKAEPENVGPHKAPDRTKRSSQARPFRALLELALQVNVGVIVYFQNVAADGRVGVMMKIAGNFFRAAFHLHLAMFLRAGPLSGIALEQAQNIIGIPIAMRNPTPEEPHLARKTGPGKLTRIPGQKLGNRITQSRRDFLVSV